MKQTHFERAIFISWYCSKRDCSFCYLSTKNFKQDPMKDRRTLASILAEVIICKSCGWKIEFLSGGCESWPDDELLLLLKNIYAINGEKQWLNIGVLNKEQLRKFKPYIQGVCGTIECINPGLREKICPSKPLKPIYGMFKFCDELKLKKSITIIIGLGETIEDFDNLRKLINEYKIDRVTFYRLKLHKGIPFKKAPETGYYAEWVKKTREEFPDIEIIVGSWLTHLNEIHLLLEAGADAITKFPSIKLFGSDYARTIEEEAKKAKRKFIGTLTKKPKIDHKTIDKLGVSDKLKKDINLQLDSYAKNLSGISRKYQDRSPI